MALGIITADQRLAAKPRGVKIVIGGPSGIGKTSLLWSLDPQRTLLIDMEAGTLAVEGWQGDILDVRQESMKLGIHPFLFLQHLACLISGPNPAVKDANKVFSAEHYAAVQQMFGERQAVIGKYDHLFFDSITQTGRYALGWAKIQPEAFSEKTGKPDTRGAYGLLGQLMVGDNGLLSHLQHCQDKDIILVGILEKSKDEYGRSEWELQIDGSKTGRELPGIVDELITMVEMEFDGKKARVFVTQQLNPWGYPAKDRSGRLDLLEEPHLGKLIAKMKSGQRAPAVFAPLPSVQPGPAQVAQQPPKEQPAQTDPQPTTVQTPANDPPPWMAGMAAQVPAGTEEIPG